MCYKITGKGYERKECVHGGKEKVKEQYYAIYINVWIRFGHRIGHSSQVCVCVCVCVN